MNIEFNHLHDLTFEVMRTPTAPEDLPCFGCRYYSVSLDELYHEIYSCGQGLYDEMQEYPVISSCVLREEPDNVIYSRR